MDGVLHKDGDHVKYYAYLSIIAFSLWACIWYFGQSSTASFLRSASQSYPKG